MFLLLMLVVIGMPACAPEIRVMTYNIRYDEPRDGFNSWAQRKDAVAGLISEYNPAFVGTQEGLLHQVESLDSVLTDYRYIGVGRDDGMTKGEFCALFYDTTMFEGVREGTFWLSESPDSVSYGWDSEYHRICTYGLFKFKGSRQYLWVLNTHFDHVAQLARKNSALLILERLEGLLKSHPAPAVVMGDFNATPDSEPVQILLTGLEDALALSPNPLEGPAGTFTGFNSFAAERRIDYVFVKGLPVRTYRHIDKKRDDGGHLSDHLPVVAEVSVR